MVGHFEERSTGAASERTVGSTIFLARVLAVYAAFFVLAVRRIFSATLKCGTLSKISAGPCLLARNWDHLLLARNWAHLEMLNI